MDLVTVVCFWNEQLKNNILKIISKYDFPLFIRLLADKQYFWYACVWMSVFTGEYFRQFPYSDLDSFFKKADIVISKMPDLFNDRIYMQAHGLLWKYGFKRFFNNINYAVEIAELLSQNSQNSGFNC